VLWVVALLATKVSPRRLTRESLPLAFAVCLGLVTDTRPRAQSVLYLQRRIRFTAVPPYISGRTSYLQVRLEFLRCPHVIPAICNWRGFGPRRAFTRASPCTWEDHLVSGRIPATLRPLQTRVRSGCGALPPLNPAADMHSPDHSTKGTPAGGQLDCHGPVTVGGDMGSGSLSFPLAGCFSPFPHGTRSLSVVRGIEPWRVVPPASHRISRVPWYSGIQRRANNCGYRTGTFCGVSFEHFASSFAHHRVLGLQPRRESPHSGLGSSAFARHYLRNLG
jgi:hypothetical protein